MNATSDKLLRSFECARVLEPKCGCKTVRRTTSWESTVRVARYLALASLIITIGCTENRPNPVHFRLTKNQDAQDSDYGSSQGSASQNTPEAVFSTYSRSVKNKDWETAIKVITRDSQELVYVGMVMQAAFMSMEGVLNIRFTATGQQPTFGTVQFHRTPEDQAGIGRTAKKER